MEYIVRKTVKCNLGCKNLSPVGKIFYIGIDINEACRAMILVSDYYYLKEEACGCQVEIVENEI